MTKNTYQDARDQLPAGAQVSSTFGYPGEGGYREYWRMPDGSRWTISNGGWMDYSPFNWTAAAVVERVP